MQSKNLHVQLREIFTDDEASFLMERFREIKSQGFSRVVIEFMNGHPDILERRIREKFPKPARTYQSE